MGNAIYAVAVEKVLSYARETMDVNKVLCMIDEMRSEQLDVDFANEAMLKALHLISEKLENAEDVAELQDILGELGIA